MKPVHWWLMVAASFSGGAGVNIAHGAWAEAACFLAGSMLCLYFGYLSSRGDRG